MVNSDFTEEAAVTAILDTWEEKRPDNGNSSHHKTGFNGGGDDDGQEGVTDLKGASLLQEVSIVFRRQGTLIIRDPILYVGRCLVFLVINSIFSLVYLSARDDEQDQALNKFWVLLWYVSISIIGTFVAWNFGFSYRTSLDCFAGSSLYQVIWE